MSSDFDQLSREQLLELQTRQQQRTEMPNFLFSEDLPQGLAPSDTPTFGGIVINGTAVVVQLQVTTQPTGTVWFSGTAGFLTPDTTNFFYDVINHRLRIVGLETKATSPAQITADQNDYNPGTGKRFRLDFNAPHSITGLAGGIDGREITLYNVSASNATITNQDAASTAANRIITGTGVSIILAPDESIDLWYDGTTGRWRVA